jgi:hypothetical protein
VDLRLVVDDQDAGRSGGPSQQVPPAWRALGRLIRMRVPRPSWIGLAAAMRPPMASTKPLEIARPRPAPLPRSLDSSMRRNLSNTRSSSAGRDALALVLDADHDIAAVLIGGQLDTRRRRL